jgi:osmotically-inducible protein OsmY
MQAKHVLFAPALWLGGRRRADAAAARRSQPTSGSAAASVDATIRARVADGLGHEPSWDASTSNVYVHDGVVFLQGLVRSAAQRRAAQVVAAQVAGVRKVQDARVPRREWQSLG